MVKRFMVYEAQLEEKAKPCVVVSPDELNRVLPYVMIAPIVSVIRPLPYRVTLEIKGKDGQLALDKLRTVPQKSLVRKIGILPETAAAEVSSILKQMFDL